MTIKKRQAERLRVAVAFGTAEEIAEALAAIARENENELKHSQRKAVGFVYSLAALGQKIEETRAAAINPEQMKRKKRSLNNE